MAESGTNTLGVVVSRLTWMLIGPLVLFLTTYFILTSGTGWRTVADVVFFVALGAMMLGRWIEFRRGAPQTATGEPATPAHLRRYIAALAIGGPLVWIAANVVGNHFLGG